MKNPIFNRLRPDARRLKNTLLRCTLAACMLTGPLARAQQQPDLASGRLQLRPLSELLDLALQQSPEIKTKEVDSQKQQLAYALQRKSWLDWVSVSSSALYGNFATLNELSTETNTGYLLNDQRSFGMNVSLNLRLSGSEIFSRGQKNEIQRLQLERIETEKQSEKQRIRAEVILLFQQLETALEMLRLKSEAVENHRLSLALAEKYFREGQYDPEKYSTVLSKATSAEEAYQLALFTCKQQTLLLQERCGPAIFQ